MDYFKNGLFQKLEYFKFFTGAIIIGNVTFFSPQLLETPYILLSFLVEVADHCEADSESFRSRASSSGALAICEDNPEDNLAYPPKIELQQK